MRVTSEESVELSRRLKKVGGEGGEEWGRIWRNEG